MGFCGRLPNGAACDINNDCNSRDCGFPERESSQRVCCQDHQTAANWGGVDYCIPIGDGGRCWSDSQCNPGSYCNSDSICQARSAPWAACPTNGDDDACPPGWSCSARTAANPNDYICVPANETTTCAGRDAYKNHSAGHPCLCNQECRSFNCKGNGGGVAGTSDWGTKTGTCT